MKMPGGTTALAALQLFILFQVCFGVERALLPQARRLLVPWIMWSVIYAFGKSAQAWLQGEALSDEFDYWMLFTGPSIHLWYLPFSFVCVAFAKFMFRALSWPVIYVLSLVIAAASLALTNTVDLTTPLAQWSTVTSAAVIGLLVKGPVRQRIVLVFSVIAMGFTVYVLGWTSGAWQTLVAAAVVLVVTEIRLPSTVISKRLSEVSFGIYLIHPAVYSVLLLVAASGTFSSYVFVIFLSAVAVFMLRRFVPVLV